MTEPKRRSGGYHLIYLVVALGMVPSAMFGCGRAEATAPAPILVPTTKAASSDEAPADRRGSSGTALREPDDNRTVSIVLPHDEPIFPTGVGRHTFLTACMVCHSLRYVTMQPNFPEEVWSKEVHKMVTDFGAHLTPGQEIEIVKYIVTFRGASAPAATHAGKHP